MNKNLFKKKFFRPLDILFFVIFVSVIVFSFINLQNKKGSRSYVYITSPEESFIYPLNKNGEYHIKGSLGESVIKIEDGSVSFLSSPCPNKTCITSGAIRYNRQWNACLPNGIMIRIENSGEDIIDAVSQ